MAYQTVTPAQLGQAAIGVAVSTLYTVGAATRAILKDIDIANSAASDVQVTVYLVPSGGTPQAPGNVLVPGVTVPKSGQYQWTGTQILPTGATIQVVASATGCTITASGGEAT